MRKNKEGSLMRSSNNIMTTKQRVRRGESYCERQCLYSSCWKKTTICRIFLPNNFSLLSRSSCPTSIPMITPNKMPLFVTNEFINSWCHIAGHFFFYCQMIKLMNNIWLLSPLFPFFASGILFLCPTLQKFYSPLFNVTNVFSSTKFNNNFSLIILLDKK